MFFSLKQVIMQQKAGRFSRIASNSRMNDFGVPILMADKKNSFEREEWLGIKVMFANDKLAIISRSAPSLKVDIINNIYESFPCGRSLESLSYIKKRVWRVSCAATKYSGMRAVGKVDKLPSVMAGLALSCRNLFNNLQGICVESYLKSVIFCSKYCFSLRIFDLFIT